MYISEWRIMAAKVSGGFTIGRFGLQPGTSGLRNLTFIFYSLQFFLLPQAIFLFTRVLGN